MSDAMKSLVRLPLAILASAGYLLSWAVGVLADRLDRRVR